MCWFERGITTSSGRPEPATGLGFLRGSNSVHYDGEPHRRTRYLEAVRNEEVPSGYGVDDAAGLLFAGTQLAEVVSSRPRARAYRVRRMPDGQIAETPLVPRELPAPQHTAPPLVVTELRAVRAARRGVGERRRVG
jgi:peptidase E